MSFRYLIIIFHLIFIISTVSSCDGGSSTEDKSDWVLLNLGVTYDGVNGIRNLGLGIERIILTNESGREFNLEKFYYDADGDTGYSEGAYPEFGELSSFGGQYIIEDSLNYKIPAGLYSMKIILDEDNDPRPFIQFDCCTEKSSYSVMKQPIEIDSFEVRGSIIDGKNKYVGLINFDLPSAISYQEGKYADYDFVFNNDGIRVIDYNKLGYIEGSVDPESLNKISVDCDNATYSIYIYNIEQDVEPQLMVDFYNSESDVFDGDLQLMDYFQKPYTKTIASLDYFEDLRYRIAVEKGFYRLALYCYSTITGLEVANGDIVPFDDDPVQIDGFQIPNPKSESIDVNVEARETTIINFPINQQ